MKYFIPIFSFHDCELSQGRRITLLNKERQKHIFSLSPLRHFTECERILLVSETDEYLKK